MSIVCSKVAGQITHLAPADRAIVERCIYGYSQGLGSLSYRVQQYMNNYPDWKHSAHALRPPSSGFQIVDNSNPSGILLQGLASFPTAISEYFQREAAGEQTLRRLIQENS
jgi:hypothetical protein